jgi:hypothetical protein
MVIQYKDHNMLLIKDNVELDIIAVDEEQIVVVHKAVMVHKVKVNNLKMKVHKKVINE